MASTYGDQITITSKDNGTVIKSNILTRLATISARWGSEDIAPAGTLTFSVDGDGMANNVMDLGAGQRTIGAVVQADSGATRFSPRFVDIFVAGIPAGGSVTLYFW